MGLGTGPAVGGYGEALTGGGPRPEVTVPVAVAAVRDALDSDLDVPAAVTAVDEAVAEGRGVVQAARLLGVDLADRDLNASGRGGGNR